MRERPMLFSGSMVRTILAGTKTQTRRALRVQPLDVLPMQGAAAGREWVGLMQRDPEPKGTVFHCKYGAPGDRLYIREHWRTTGDGGRADYLAPRDLQPHPVWYEADGTAPGEQLVGKARRAFHMPRWASRITLEITGVRVERLQDISEADAVAEGCEEEFGHAADCMSDDCVLAAGYDDCAGHLTTAKENYQLLWDSINGAGSWDANPWVWVVEFQRVPQ